MGNKGLFAAGVLAMVAVAAVWLLMPKAHGETAMMVTKKVEKRPTHLLRVATYNIHIGKDIHNKLNLAGTIETLRESDADLIGLQEVEKNGPRTHFTDQAKEIATALGMDYRFEHGLKVGPFEFGNVLLSRYPILSVERIELPSKHENRVVLLAKVDVAGKETNVLVTHLGLQTDERKRDVLLVDERLANLQGPTLLLGDFNAPAHAPEMAPWFQRLASVTDQPLETFQGLGQIDHILATADWDVRKVFTVEGTASDHLPLVAELRWKPDLQQDL